MKHGSVYEEETLFFKEADTVNREFLTIGVPGKKKRQLNCQLFI
jgi:hypothetical protein